MTMWELYNGLLKNSSFPFKHAVTTRLCGDAKDRKTQETICGQLSVDCGALVTAQQVHGTRVAVVEKADRGRHLKETDGLVTGCEGIPLAVFTADCLPVFLGDKKRRAAGVVHAGWRGLAAGIIREAVRVFKEHFSIDASDITAAIGPHIKKCCFEVGGDVLEAFNKEGSRANLDMECEAVKQLKELGVGAPGTSQYCTFHDSDLFFSYRREKTKARMMSLIQL